MITFTRVILLLAFLSLTKADLCSDNFTIRDLPGGLREEVISLILTGVHDGYADCTRYPPVVDEDVKFMFYNRTYQGTPMLLDPNNPLEVDPNKPTIFLIHGWTCSITDGKMPEIKQAYLDRYDCNVIGVDWSARSVDLMSAAFCSVPGVAKIVGKLLCVLNSVLRIDLRQVHIVGHSMGAHIAGLAGQDVQTRCNQVTGRITGLDPGGIQFQNLKESDRLDASDAAFVDIIHTNQAILGYYGVCGAADFFPNCGTFQPGCLKVDFATTPAQIANLPITVAACSHFRSCEFWIESIRSDSKPFSAASCRTCPGAPFVGPCVKDLINLKHARMGEDCPNPPPDSKFHLITNAQSPFSRG